jgi:hypothetical protein
LVITLETFLQRQGYSNVDTRRAKRLKMLSIITEMDVKSTYDLSAYQCAIINGFLYDPENGWQPYDWAEEFLSDLSHGMQGLSIQRARGNDPDSVWESSPGTPMPDMS